MGAEFPRRRDELDYDGDEKCLLMTGLRKNTSPKFRMVVM